MTPEERADNAVKDVANVTGGYANTAGRDVIARVIRDAVLAERERCAALCERVQAEMDKEFAPEGCTDAAREAAERIREGPK